MEEAIICFKNKKDKKNNGTKDIDYKYLYEKSLLDIEQLKNKIEKYTNKCINCNNIINNDNKIKNEAVNSLNKKYIQECEEIKIKKLKNKIRINIIKNKTIDILRILNEQSIIYKKVIENIIHKNNILDLKTLKEEIIKNKKMINQLSESYEKYIINKSINKNEFILKVKDFYKDTNITRIIHICKITYFIRNNEKIWNSKITFEHLYIFKPLIHIVKPLKDIYIKSLISDIEKIIKKEGKNN